MEQTPEAQPATKPNSPPKSPTHHQPPFSLPPSIVPSNPQNPNPNPNPSPNSNPNPNPSSSLPYHRPWDPQTQTQYRHFAPPSTPTSASGMAIGVPAAPTSFSSLNPNSYGQRFGNLARPESTSSTSTPQVRPPVQGSQGMGMRGPMGVGPPARVGGIAMQHQQRPIQSSARPQTNPTNQPLASQNLQGHGMSRGPAVGSAGSSLPGTSQSMMSHNQPWLSSGAPTRPPLPNAPFRAQMNHPPSLQQRSHIPQQHHHPVSMPSQRPQPPSSQHLQPSSSSEGTQGSQGQQISATRVSQQQISKVPGSGNQKLDASNSQPSMVSKMISERTESLEIIETCNRIISKRSIQELLAQIDPTEKMDPEVEDFLVDIAEDFVESITTSACSLAKHRKSTTLEAKDILIHLDRNWNMTLPGFAGDEIKCYKKPSVNDIHKERLAVIRKSVVTGDVIKSSTGQAAGSAKGHLAKAVEVTQP